MLSVEINVIFQMNSIRLSIRAHEIGGIFLLHDQRIKYLAKIILHNIFILFDRWTTYIG